MDLGKCSPVLFVKEIGISKSFYENVLGLQVELDFGKNVIFRNGFSIWEIREDHIIPSLLGPENLSDPRTNRFELYFETENLEEIYCSLGAAGIRFLHQLNEEPWGQKTIRFFDPDNHLIEIGESMRRFVTRFRDQGLTNDQISSRTSVPMQEVERLLKDIQG